MSSDSGSDSGCEDRPAHALRHRRSVNYGKIVEDMSNTMEFSGLEIYNWEDDDLALRYAAARARLPYDRLSADELNYFADVTKSKPSKNLYLYLRNKCLQFWQMGPQVQLTLEAFKDQIKSPFNSDPLLIQRVHAFLERFCYINYGVFHITNYKNLSSKRKVIIIGAGFSGLAAALQLKYFGYDVVVLEARPRFGGRAMTYRFRPETEKIDADLGAMIVMGVVGNPIMTLIDQNPIRIAQVNGVNCSIYEAKGQKLAPEKDRRITSAWNTLLDTCCYISKEMKINKLNTRSLSLGETMDLVCNQMELRAQRRRLNYWTHLHDLTERQQRFLQQCYILGEVIDDLTQKIEQAIKNKEEYLFDIEIYKIQSKEELSRFLELRCYRRDLKMAIDKFKSLTAEIESQRAHYKELLRVEPCQVYMNSHDKQIVDFHKANLEYANGAPLHKISLEYWDADDEWEFDGSHFMIKGGYSKLVSAYTEKLQDVLKKMHVASKVEYNDNGVQVSGVYEDSTGKKPFVEKGDICICTVPLGVLKWSVLKTEDPSTKIKFDPPLPKWKVGAIERMGFGSLNKLVLLFDKIFWDPNEEIFARMSETTEARGECFQFFAVPRSPVLIALIAGAAANIPEGQNAETLLVNRTMLFLRQTFPGCPPQPTDYVLTRWHKDRFSRGCYSYISVDSSDKDHEELAEPVVDANGKPRLLFAGEHTICRWPSTVHGAILSGMREATRVVDTFQGTLPIYATAEEIAAAKAAATAPYGVIPKKDLEEDDDEDIEEIEVKVSENNQNGNQNGQVTKPLIIVSGCTGTGKSDLAIAIAKRFGGDVISADSMQIYKGLDVVTNKVTEEEMDGVKHHLMSFYDPTMAEYNIHEFKSSVLKIAEDLWKEGKLPVIAGGTQYYVEGVIYKGNLVDEEGAQVEKNPEIRKVLEKMSNEELYEKLKEIDPESANLVHKNNRFRVLRSVEICLLTGKKKSEIVEEQKKTDLDGGLRFQNTLLINIDADPKVLDERLKKRIEKMITRGLEKELVEFYDMYRESLRTHGVLQSIGLKEFLSFLELPKGERESEKGEQLFRKGAEALTLHTIQYAKRQRRWLKSRFLTRQGTRELPRIIGLDSSKTDKFFTELVPIATELVGRFLKADDLKLEEYPEEFVNDPLKQVSEDELRTVGHVKRANAIFTCTACKIDVHGEEAWKNHLGGRKHKRNSKVRRVEE